MKEIKKSASAGTVESNDILIMMSPGQGAIKIDLESIVEKQYGSAIKELIHQVLEEEGISNVNVIAKDKGALDFTIRARLKTCIQRGRADEDEL